MSSWRSSLGFALALAALAGCGDIPRPFEDENKQIAPSPLLVPKADAALIVVPIRGAPREVSVELAELLAERLRGLDLMASTRAANPNSRILEGEATVTALPGDLAAVEIVWRVVEPNGLAVATTRQTERVPAALWRRGDRTILSKMVADVAPRIEREIRVDGGILPAVASMRVRVPVVEGAPGDGNEALARAMRLLLTRQDVSLVDVADAAAISLLGMVNVSPAGPQDRVDIQWIVRASDGRSLGTVRQSNTVPRGTLSGRWGPIAYAAAEGGVDGVMQVLEAQKRKP